MIDPVDTEALRELSARPAFTNMQRIDRSLESSRALAAAADEVDRLRAALKDADDRLALGVLVNLDGEQFVDHPVMQMLAEKNERLRAVIKNAPHWVSENDAADCCGWYSDDNYCNCWKKGAL